MNDQNQRLSTESDNEHPIKLKLHRRPSSRCRLHGVTNEKPLQRKSNGRWAKGTSGNQSGRPAGSRNKATVAIEQMLGGEAERLSRKAIDLALGGEVAALRLCMERLLPPLRDRLIQLDLPPLQSARQVSMALASVFAAIADGQITPAEGATLANILAVQKGVIATADLEGRVDRLEERVLIDYKEDGK